LKAGELFSETRRCIRTRWWSTETVDPTRMSGVEVQAPTVDDATGTIR
jgi:hypothetical protein